MNDIKFKAYLKLTNETVDVQKIDIENKQISFYKNNDDGYLYVCDFKNIEFIFVQQDIRQQLDESFTEEDVEGLIEDRNKTIKFLQKQLAEKDKEIEKLKQQYTILENENGKLTTELIMDKYKKAQKEVSFGKQLAIQELEKVKEDCFNQKELVDFGNVACFMVDIADILEIINNQIKELKGEK